MRSTDKPVIKSHDFNNSISEFFETKFTNFIQQTEFQQ